MLRVRFRMITKQDNRGSLDINNYLSFFRNTATLVKIKQPSDCEIIQHNENTLKLENKTLPSRFSYDL